MLRRIELRSPMGSWNRAGAVELLLLVMVADHRSGGGARRVAMILLRGERTRIVVRGWPRPVGAAVGQCGGVFPNSWGVVLCVLLLAWNGGATLEGGWIVARSGGEVEDRIFRDLGVADVRDGTRVHGILFPSKVQLLQSFDPFLRERSRIKLAALDARPQEQFLVGVTIGEATMSVRLMKVAQFVVLDIPFVLVHIPDKSQRIEGLDAGWQQFAQSVIGALDAAPTPQLLVVGGVTRHPRRPMFFKVLSQLIVPLIPGGMAPIAPCKSQCRQFCLSILSECSRLTRRTHVHHPSTQTRMVRAPMWDTTCPIQHFVLDQFIEPFFPPLGLSASSGAVAGAFSSIASCRSTVGGSEVVVVVFIGRRQRFRSSVAGAAAAAAAAFVDGGR